MGRKKFFVTMTADDMSEIWNAIFDAREYLMRDIRECMKHYRYCKEHGDSMPELFGTATKWRRIIARKMQSYRVYCQMLGNWHRRFSSINLPVDRYGYIKTPERRYRYE